MTRFWKIERVDWTANYCVKSVRARHRSCAGLNESKLFTMAVSKHVMHHSAVSWSDTDLHAQFRCPREPILVRSTGKCDY
jgi:hypothetical protein